MKRLDHPALPRIVDIIDDGQTICCHGLWKVSPR